MKKLKNSFVAFVLVVIMSGSALLGGAASIANTAFNQHVSASSAASLAFKPLYPCPHIGSDC